MTKEDFKNLYNKFTCSWPIPDEKYFDDFSKEWGEYSKIIISPSGLSFDKTNGEERSWIKSSEKDSDYLPRFIERNKIFGSARVGRSEQYMIYRNWGEKKGKYYDAYMGESKQIDRYFDENDKGKITSAGENYKDKIQSLLKKIVESIDIQCLAKIERENVLWREFSSKQILRKMAVLNSVFNKNFIENNFLLWIYDEKVIDNLVDIFEFSEDSEPKISEDSTFFEKSNAVWTKAVEWLKETEVNDWKNGCPSTITTFNYVQFAKLNNLLWELGNNNAGELTNFDVPNVIYHGAPGTGKTYTTLQTVKLLCAGNGSEYKYCQFHPSYSYQDFIEGIKPMGIVGGNVNLEVVNGIFKQFCIYVKEKNETFYEGFKNNNKGNAPKIDDYPHYYFIVDEINRGDLSRIFGETFSLLEPDYRDKDFSKPKDGYKNNEHLIVTPLSNVIEKTSNKEGLAYKIIGGKVYFGIPFNIHFIGLMNDVDKSIDTFDLALRRRFKWITKKCDYDVIQDSLLDKISNKDEVADYKKSCEALNEFITKPEGLGLSKNYQLGQSYFMKIVNMLSSKSKTITETVRKSVFENYIETTLREYAREVCDENEIDDKINGAKKAFGIDIEKTTDNDEE